MNISAHPPPPGALPAPAATLPPASLLHFFFNYTEINDIYTFSINVALPIFLAVCTSRIIITISAVAVACRVATVIARALSRKLTIPTFSVIGRSEEHASGRHYLA